MSLIVILDDRATNRAIFSRLAASIEPSVEVLVFADPADALAAFADKVPDLIITDFKMPTMDGATFIRHFRAMPGCADVPVVVLTVYEERSYRLAALEAGATDFLQSPVDHHEFVTRARNLLKLRRQHLMLQNRAAELARDLEHSERSREELLRNSRERLAEVIDTVPAMIRAADRQGRCVFANAYHTKLYGADPSEIVGMPLSQILGEEAAERSHSLDRMVFTTGAALPSFEEEVVDKTGGKRILLTTKSPLHNGHDQVVHVLTTSLDITERKRAERHLTHLAHHDALTDLPNRILLRDRLRREIALARRGDRMFALHLVDLDRFKAINDLLGHAVGDALLRGVAERLLTCAKERDTVARIGGDEFAILQTGIRSAADALEFAERVNGALALPIDIDGQSLETTASIGITLHPPDGIDVDALIKNADAAMYQAKSEGGACAKLYAADMTEKEDDALAIHGNLRQALANEEFFLMYQPQIDLRTGFIVGAEALIRWNRPGVGLVSPGSFLPLAEENGSIIRINEWVLREACREAQSWIREGLPPLRIAVNMSPVQFRRRVVRDLVTSALAETGLEPWRLELELTESIVMQDADVVVEDMHALRKLGVALSIDDFGTGYSSLAYVKRFPVDRLKIDQCFIRSLTTDPNDAAIVRAIVSLGHSLKLGVIAEGVETREQLNFLRAEGCDEVQGYLLSRPISGGDFVDLVRRHNALSWTA